MQLFNLAGRVAIVTGSTRGIGKAIAERLAEHGARVAISSRKEAACREVADAIVQRFGEPDDVAGLAVCLAGPASRFVTGQTWVVDGGDMVA